MIELLTIMHTPKGKRPLTVTFRTGGREETINATAAQVESFAAFRRLVLSELGLLIRHHAEC
ncbi:MAG: hypothetical protein ACYTG0_44920, partial [Planctomycetota bacterium]